jgi:hypothetical protein
MSVSAVKRVKSRCEREVSLALAERFHSNALVEPTLEFVKTHGCSPLTLHGDDRRLRELATGIFRPIFLSFRVVPRITPPLYNLL